MASEVDISNLALARLGASATISSFKPPDGSPHAEHCARFYPIARNTLLEMHAWGFATRRVALAPVANTSSQWTYAYAGPSSVQSYLNIFDPDAPDDSDPKPFIVEADANGNDIVYTNQENAVLQYVITITDPTKFSALFTDALAWLLASYIAGPIIKGDNGIKASQNCYKACLGLLPKAKSSDANNRKTSVTHSVPWIARR